MLNSWSRVYGEFQKKHKKSQAKIIEKAREIYASLDAPDYEIYIINQNSLNSWFYFRQACCGVIYDDSVFDPSVDDLQMMQDLLNFYPNQKRYQ